MWLINELLLHQAVIISSLSNLTVFAILGALAKLYTKFKCKLCWRISLHKVVGTTYRTCTKHATPADHDALAARHATECPEQHELMNR